MNREKKLFQIPVSAFPSGTSHNTSGISRDLPCFDGAGKQNHHNVTDKTFITLDSPDLADNYCCRQPDRWNFCFLL